MACDPQKPMNFQIFAYARRRLPRSKEDNRGQKIAQKKDPKYVNKTTNQSSFLRSRLGRPKKVQKMTSWSLPGAPQGAGNATQNGPKTRQEDPKMVPRALLSIFKLLFSAQSALLRPTWRPRRPTPGGAKFELWGFFWDPRASIFMTLSGAGGAIL